MAAVMVCLAIPSPSPIVILALFELSLVSRPFRHAGAWKGLGTRLLPTHSTLPLVFPPPTLVLLQHNKTFVYQVNA